LQGRIRKPHRLQTRLVPCGRGWARNSLPDLRGLMLSEGNFSQCRSESCFRELGMRMVSKQRNCYLPLFGFRAARRRSRGSRSSHLSRMLSFKSAQLPQVVRFCLSTLVKAGTRALVHIHCRCCGLDRRDPSGYFGSADRMSTSVDAGLLEAATVLP